MSVTRLSPQVQRIQSQSPYVDIYSGATKSPLRTRPHTKLYMPGTVSHAHPDPPRWQDADDWGARHMHDRAPFVLWDKQSRHFAYPKQPGLDWIKTTFSATAINWLGWYMVIETAQPPQPVPFTIGRMPVRFVRPGDHDVHIRLPTNMIANPRGTDPCPQLKWPPLTRPSAAQMVTFMTGLSTIANFRAVHFLPDRVVVELEVDDGRVYGPYSLSTRVGNRITLYHHSKIPYFSDMTSKTRVRLLDPRGTALNPAGTTPQDVGDYVRQTGYLSPGIRVESGKGALGSATAGKVYASSAGALLRNRFTGEERLVVAHHASIDSKDVYHPFVDENKIGVVVESRPELDVALVQLTPTAAQRFTNSCYFQAEPPKELVRSEVVEGMRKDLDGSWSEVDGMSSGLISLMCLGVTASQPLRPPGHPEIPFCQWYKTNVQEVFGAINDEIVEGIRGAPIVQSTSGKLSGFFHLSDGAHCFTAALDPLIEEGWEVAR